MRNILIMICLAALASGCSVTTGGGAYQDGPMVVKQRSSLLEVTAFTEKQAKADAAVTDTIFIDHPLDRAPVAAAPTSKSILDVPGIVKAIVGIVPGFRVRLLTQELYIDATADQE